MSARQKNTTAETTLPKKRMTVRVIASILATDAEGTWRRVNSFELVSKELTHDIALRKAVAKHKRDTLTMTDENTVEAAGPQTHSGPTKTVYSVLRYSGQCPECGAPANKPNTWCDLCMSQIANSEVAFDSEAALEALLSGIAQEEDDEDDE